MKKPAKDSPRLRDKAERRVNPLMMMTFWLGAFFAVIAAIMMFG